MSALPELARRLHAAAAHAGTVARGTEILSARLYVASRETHRGIDEAVQHHAEQAQVLADAHAFVVRCAAEPKLLDVLAALENGQDVTIGPRLDYPAPASVASARRPARAVVVGDAHHATPTAARPWSRVLDVVIPGHRKSSSPAHLCAPASVGKQSHRSLATCSQKLAGNGQ